MASKLISFRDTDLYDRIVVKAAKDNRSFADTARGLMQLGLDCQDNRVLPDVAAGYGRTGLRIIATGPDKSLHTVALRDDPLGQMRDAGDIDNRQYEIGRHVEWHFLKWHGQSPRSNHPSRERISASRAGGVWHDGEGLVKEQVTRDLSSIPTNDEAREAREFLRRVRETLGARAYQLVADVIYSKKPTLKVQQFAAALDRLAPLCGVDQAA
jgi:hypothetical protein